MGDLEANGVGGNRPIGASLTIATDISNRNCAELRRATMQPVSADDRTANVLGREDIKAIRQPSHITQQCDSRTLCRAACWSSVVTIMPYIPCQHPISWRRDETNLKEEERLAYNRRMEVVRQMEYPMLKGMFDSTSLA